MQPERSSQTNNHVVLARLDAKGPGLSADQISSDATIDPNHRYVTRRLVQITLDLD
jgi:hypothetical protein